MTAGPGAAAPSFVPVDGRSVRAWLLRGLVFALLVGAVIGGIATGVRYLQAPSTPPAGQVRIAAADLPRPGEAPVYVAECRCLLVALPAGAGLRPSLPPGIGVPAAPRDGLLVLSARSPERGCTIVWQPQFTFEGITGWLRDPCYGGVFTLAGLPVFGRAPRPMDTLAARFEPDGALTVFVGRITAGAADNPLRTVPPYDPRRIGAP